MYKILRANKDTYITDRVIKGTRSYTSNVGIAGSLDLFKLYGITTSGSNNNCELSRLLIHFDLTSLFTSVNNGTININDSSFDCRIKLFDVYGGQTCPTNFTVSVNPLSQSFDEGAGKDSTFYTDIDVSNFLTASRPNNLWLLSGANYGGDVSGSCDYITFANGVDLTSTQFFTTGEENLYVDVTKIISSTIATTIPDCGFRISFSQTHENDQRTYFVKRFASRHAFNADKRPQLIIRYDDSVFDDLQTFEFDIDNTLYLRNYSRGVLTNMMSGSSQITGSNCLLLKLSTEISGGMYDLYFTGSQVPNSVGFTTGTYRATANISSTSTVIHNLLSASNSLNFTPIWTTLDATHAYHTGSTILATVQNRTSNVIRGDYSISALGLQNEHYTTETVLVEVTIFDVRTPYTMIMRIPAETPSLVIHDVFYAVRDAITNSYVIPFDDEKNSTKLSSDGTNGMFFNLDMSSLTAGRNYVIDVMIKSRGGKYVYKSVSPTFKVINSL